MQSTKFYGGIEVEPGAVIDHTSRLDLRFSIVSVCQSAQPEHWVGEVRLQSHVLLQTEQFSDPYAAARAAQQAVESRIASILSDPGRHVDLL